MEMSFTQFIRDPSLLGTNNTDQHYSDDISCDEYESEKHSENGSESSSGEEYDVNEILDKRVRDGNVQYLIKWKGFSSLHNSWEPIENLHCDELIAEYEYKVVLYYGFIEPEQIFGKFEARFDNKCDENTGDTNKTDGNETNGKRVVNCKSVEKEVSEPIIEEKINNVKKNDDKADSSDKQIKNIKKTSESIDNVSDKIDDKSRENDDSSEVAEVANECQQKEITTVETKIEGIIPDRDRDSECGNLVIDEDFVVFDP